MLNALVGGSEFAERKVMRGILLGNVIVDCETYWQESSEAAERKVMCGILLGNSTAEWQPYWQESSEVAEREINRKVKRK